MTSYNPHLTAEIAGLQNPITFAGTNKEKVAQLRVMLSMEDANEADQRMFLDEMSPACRNFLVRILTDLEASITNAV